MTQTATAAKFHQIGREAFAGGESSAPAANADVLAAIETLQVGQGAAAIMRAFRDGWHEANLAAVVR